VTSEGEHHGRTELTLRKLQEPGYRRQACWAAYLSLVLGACGSKTIEPVVPPAASPNSTTQSAPAQSITSLASATPIGSSRTVPTPPELPATELPRGYFVATWVEANVQRYATFDVAPDGVVHGTSLGPWESLIEDKAKPAALGFMLATTPCASVQPPPVPELVGTNDIHLLSMPTHCVLLELAGHPKTKAALQWYGFQSKDHSIAVLRPEMQGKHSWLLVLADTMLSPAGPWLALTMADLDGDGLQDIAFVAQGVDGCDRGPCPLYWIDILMSRTHTVMRGDSAVLLTTGDFEQKTGLPWFEATGKLTWQGRVDAGHYSVTVSAGKRKLTWSVLLESNGLVVRPGVPRGVSKS